LGSADHGRRSGFLVFAAVLANAFLAGIAIDGTIALIDDLFIRSDEASSLFLMRGVLGGGVILLTILMLFLVIFVPQLPKIVLGPPLLIELWLLFGAVPIPWSLSDRSTWIPLEVIHLSGALFAFTINRVTTGHWFLAASRMPRRPFSTLRTLIAIPVAAFAVVVLAVGIVVGGVAVFLQDQTKGYLQFASSGIEVRESVMRKGDKEVHLVATVHLGDPAFYRDVYRSMPDGALVLAEGVSDREGRLKRGLSYNNVAQALGLESQDVFERMLGPPRESDPSTPPGAGTAEADKPAPSTEPAKKKGPDIVRADIDVSEFTPLTLRFIGRVSEIYGSRTFDEAMRKLTEVSGEFTDADIQLVMDDLIVKRNTRVLAELDKRLANYRVVFIPWGAQHMPDLESSLRERGFTIVEQRMRLIARYGTIYNALVKRDQREAARSIRSQTALARIVRRAISVPATCSSKAANSCARLSGAVSAMR